jgi:putative ABC transport system substrate-binding protein
LEILQTLTPKAEGFAVLINPSNPNIEAYSRDVQEATRALGRQIDIYKVGNESDYEKAFAALSQRRTGGVVVSADPVFVARPDKLVSVITRHSIPAVYPYREFVTAGGLMSYGPKLSDAMRQAGTYTGRVLKGAKPADLPVQEFTDIELVINLKVAKGLGLTVPIPLLSRANEVIE